MYCHFMFPFLDPCALSTSMQLVTAYKVEQDLKEARRKELEQSEAEKKRNSVPRPY